MMDSETVYETRKDSFWAHDNIFPSEEVYSIETEDEREQGLTKLYEALGINTAHQNG